MGYRRTVIRLTVICEDAVTKIPSNLGKGKEIVFSIIDNIIAGGL